MTSKLDIEVTTQPSVAGALLVATKALLRITSPADAREVAAQLVRTLGGQVVPETAATRTALPIDLSFGDGAPLLPAAPLPAVRQRLEHLLPAFVEDAHRALARLPQRAVVAQDPRVDPVTGLPRRRVLDCTPGRVGLDDVVVVIGLDDLDRAPTDLGLSERDIVLHRFVDVVLRHLRPVDRLAGRTMGELVVVLPAVQDPSPILRAVRDDWVRARAHSVSFSAGVATGEHGGDAAIRAADRARDRARRSGPEQWRVAIDEDYI